jgi:uncharacterized protein (DUF2236 family)
MRCQGCRKCEGRENGVLGAGVLILTESTTFPGEHDVILFKDYTGMYTDAGGHCDDSPPDEAASKELYEESRTIVHIDVNTIRECNFIDIPSYKHTYRCYVVNVPRIQCRDFYEIDTRYMPRAFRETTRMRRFPLRYVRERIFNGQLTTSVIDKSGNEKPLSDRARKVLVGLYGAE